MVTNGRQFGSLLSAAAIAAMAGGIAPGTAMGQCNNTKLLASDRQNTDFAGNAVATFTDLVSGTPRVMMAASSDDTADGAAAGSVYVFGRVNNVWTQLQHFFANDGQPSDRFGESIACADPYAIIGATGVGDTGAAYIYERFGSWLFAAKFIPPGAGPGDDAGRDVAITADNGGWALIGSPSRDVDLSANSGVSDPNAGVVTLVRRTASFTWSVVDTFPARFGANAGYAAEERFGSAVAINGDIAVCGVPYGENINYPDNHGYIQPYRRQANNTWTSSGRLFSNNASADDHYGASVATDGTFIAIGAPDDDATAAQLPGLGAKSNSGCVYIQRWQAGDWYIDGQVFAPDATDNARFGSRVSIDGDSLVVAASGAKKVYVLKRLAAGDWAVVRSINDPDDSAGGTFGSAVSAKGGQLAIGDLGDDDGILSGQGAAYVYSLPDPSAAADSCEGAGAISGHGEYTGCTANATPSVVSPVTTCGNGGPYGPGPDVWYSWTPECSGNVIIDTYGSNFDTVLSVHSGCPTEAATSTVACNDDGGGFLGVDSIVTFNYFANQTYLIRIGGYNGSSGDYVLRVNDWATPANDSCATAQHVGNGSFTFSNCRADSQVLLGQSCSANSGLNPVRDVWYLYTAECSGIVKADTCGSGFDTVLQVFSADACPTFNSAAIVCADDSVPTCGTNQLISRVEFEAAGAGQQFYIRVGAYDHNPANVHFELGDGVLHIACETWCPCDWDQNGVKEVPDIFAYLTSWFAGAGNADFNHNTFVDVPDIFAFLTCWFGPCP